VQRHLREALGLRGGSGGGRGWGTCVCSTWGQGTEVEGCGGLVCFRPVHWRPAPCTTAASKMQTAAPKALSSPLAPPRTTSTQCATSHR
jgi:hypothetical protein